MDHPYTFDTGNDRTEQLSFRKMRKGNKSGKKKAGHRSWAPRNAPVKGTHKGDIMSSEKRSALMSRIKGKNTTPERIIIGRLEQQNLTFEKHARNLSGSPDIVFNRERLAVFIDGDFWHGWRFPLWKHKLSLNWQEKIQKNRERDQVNFKRLRRGGWKVLRIWEHQVERNPEKCIKKIMGCIKAVPQDAGTFRG